MKYPKNEVISLYWDGYTPDAYYVKGHMNPVVALYLLALYYGWKEIRGLGMPEPLFARWEVGDLPDGCTYGLKEHAFPGKGVFPIMVLYRYAGPNPKEIYGGRS